MSLPPSEMRETEVGGSRSMKESCSEVVRAFSCSRTNWEFKSKAFLLCISHFTLTLFFFLCFAEPTLTLFLSFFLFGTPQAHSILSFFPALPSSLSPFFLFGSPKLSLSFLFFLYNRTSGTLLFSEILPHPLFSFCISLPSVLFSSPPWSFP